MPELKPCPACGSRGVICILDDDEMYSVDCGNCAMRGPAEHNPDFAEAAWNSLPRRPDYNDVDCAGCPERRRSALTWTTEPPKAAGWYWWRTSKGQNVNIIQVWSRSGVLGYCFDTEFITTLDRGEWAGPIPTPIEPEAS